MTTTVLEAVVEEPRKSFPWQAMLTFLTEAESNAGTVLLQRNSPGSEVTGNVPADTLMGIIGLKGTTKSRIHKLADQDDSDSN